MTPERKGTYKRTFSENLGRAPKHQANPKLSANVESSDRRVSVAAVGEQDVEQEPDAGDAQGARGNDVQEAAGAVGQQTVL